MDFDYGSWLHWLKIMHIDRKLDYSTEGSLLQAHVILNIGLFQELFILLKCITLL